MDTGLDVPVDYSIHVFFTVFKGAPTMETLFHYMINISEKGTFCNRIMGNYKTWNTE